jgi:hypothetical protein
VSDGAGVPTSCLEPADLRVGVTFRLTRREEIAGTCTPLLYDIPASSAAHVCACAVCDDTGTGGCF